MSKGLLAGIAAAAAIPVAVAGIAFTTADTVSSAADLLGENTSSLSVDATATSYAQQLIPAKILALEQSPLTKSECPGLSWTVVAAITHLESDDNRNPSTSPSGAMGANQFLPTTWDNQGLISVRVGEYGKVPDGEGYGVDGDGDGIANILDPADSIPSAARYLCANGGGNPKTLPQAIYTYNHAWWYVYGGDTGNGSHFEGVLPLAAKLGQASPSAGRSVVVAAAFNELGIPYSFDGGNTSGPTYGVCTNDAGWNDCHIVGFDCSGLTLWAYAKAGIIFPHSAASQYTLTSNFSVSEANAQPGDLVFFTGDDGSYGAPGHVGIYIGNDQMIDAPESGEVIQVNTVSTWGGLVGFTDPFAWQASQQRQTT